MSKREEVIKIFSEYLMGIDPSGFNLKFYQDHQFKYKDAEFKKWMTDIKEGKDRLVIYCPASSGVKLDHKRNLKFAKKKGVGIYERIWFSEENGIPEYLTPVKYLVMPTPRRRQAQLLTKKISVPGNMKSINPLTGQPTGSSQGAKMSLPETQLLAASGLHAALKEVLGPRAGDSGAGAALTGMLVTTGKASLKNLSLYSSGVEVTKYMKAIFTAAHIRIAPL